MSSKDLTATASITDSKPVSSAPPEVALPDSSQVLGLLGEVESRLDALRQWQSQTDRQCSELQRRAEMIDAQQQQAQSLEARVRQQQAELDQTRQEIGLRLDELAAREAALEEAGQVIEFDREQIHEERELLAGECAALEKRRAEMDARHQEMDAAWGRYHQQQEALGRRSETLDARFRELEARTTELDERADQLDRDRASLKSDWDAFQLMQEEFAEQQAGLARAREELEADQQKLAEGYQELEAYREESQQIREELQQEKKQVQKIKIDLKLREEALHAQQEHLDRAREEIAEQAILMDEGDMDSATAQKAREARARFEKDRLELEKERAELHELRGQIEQREHAIDEQLQEVRQQRESVQQKLADVERQRQEFQDRRAELEKSSQELQEKALVAQRQVEESLRREQELHQLSERLDKKQVELDQRRAEFRRTLEESHAKVAEEREGVRQAETDLKQRLTEVETEREKYERRRAQAREIEETQRQRRKKLHRYRSLLRTRSRSLQEAELKVESSVAQYAGLEKERAMLVEVKRFLETSESEMVDRWATQRAATLVVWGVVALIALAGFSFLVGKQLASPVWQSSMTLQVKPGASPEIEDLTVAATGSGAVDAIRRAVYSDTVLGETLGQLDQRGLRMATGVGQLKSILEDQLAIEGAGSQVTLVYSSAHGPHVEPVLEALGRAVLSYQMTQDRQAGRGDTTSVQSPARGLDRPVQDESLSVAAMILGILTLVALVAGFVVRMLLRRSRRVFDPQTIPGLETLDKPQTWSPLPAVRSEVAEDEAEEDLVQRTDVLRLHEPEEDEDDQAAETVAGASITSWRQDEDGR